MTGLAILLALGALAILALLFARRVRRGLRARNAQLDRLFREGRVAATAVVVETVRSPLAVEEIECGRSPFTGLTYASWSGFARQMLEGVLQHSDQLRAPLRMPPSLHSNYPRLEPNGSVYGIEEEYLEAFCRSLWLAAPLLSRTPDWRLHGRAVADYYREYLIRGAIPMDEAWLGTGRGSSPTPHIMEAAAVCVALRQAREVLWEPLSDAERGRIAAWLDLVRARPVNGNNWRWFSVIVETFLKVEGFRHDAERVSRHLEVLRGFHVDAGWSRDLDKFDYYSAWSLQFYPIFWMRWDGASNPSLRDEFTERNDQFLGSFSHLFSRRGELPLWGRSPIYRFGAAAPLAAAFLRSSAPAIDPGFARRLASGSLLQFVQHPGFLRRGIPSLGWLGERPEIMDSYSGVASPLWCAKLFCALTLPPESPFWSAPENEGFWADAPERVELGRTGMWVTHDRASGHTRLFAPQRVAGTDSRYQAAYFDTSDAT